MKTNKHQTLFLIKEKNGLHTRDMVHVFHYSPGTARSYLSHLGRQQLVQPSERGHILTQKGQDRLQFFEVEGCGDPACPRCQGKAGCYTCLTCGLKMQKAKARLKPAWDTIFFTRRAGVFCYACHSQILNEDQAKLAGIPEEDNP